MVHFGLYQLFSIRTGRFNTGRRTCYTFCHINSQPSRRLMATRETKVLSYSITATLLVIASVFIVGIWWRNTQNSNYESVKKENTSLLLSVGKLLDLLSEDPTITTISNKEDFKNETFYNKIETGDKLLVYLNADQAIFYRPSSNTVTMMLPVSAYLKNYK